MNLRRVTLTAALAAGLAACAFDAYRLVAIDIPAVSPVAVERYPELVIEDFRETGPAAEVPLGPKMAEYLEAEMKREFKGAVSRRSPGGTPAGGLVLSGTVGIVPQAQKALRDEDLPKDGPFRLETRGLIERKRFILTFEYRLTDAATGETLLTGSAKKSRTYGDIEQTLEFALFDLFPMVKAELFPAIFGRASAGERYLLLR